MSDFGVKVGQQRSIAEDRKTLLDEMAIAFMSAQLIADPLRFHSEHLFRERAKSAYAIAKAMMTERESQK